MGILTIDDRDPLLSYAPAGSWGQEGAPVEYNGTTSVAQIPGQTVALTFSGTSVGVFGTIASLADSNGQSPPQTSYVIDSASPTKFTATLTNATQYNQRFYSSGTLSAGQHTLLVTLLSTNSTFFLDYIQVVPMDMTISSSSSSSSSSTSSSSSVSSSSSFSTQTSLSTSSSTVSIPSAASSLATAKKGASTLQTSTIIGVSLGILALVIIMFFVVLFMQKRRRDRKFRRMLDSKTITTESLWTRRYTAPRSNSSITPFITAQYQPINDDTPPDLPDNHTYSTRAVPYNAYPTPPRQDISSLKSKGFSHSPSSSQHIISTQDSRANTPMQGGSASNQPSSSTPRPAIHHGKLDRPPPQYHD